MVVSDIYPLAQSVPFELKPTEEARVDLVLRKKPSTPATRICGRVLTCDHEPINKATVKVLDRDYNPVTHTLTDENGMYVMNLALAPGCYRLTAAAEGFITARTIDFKLSSCYPKHINILMKQDPICGMAVIYGLTTGMKKQDPLADTLLVLCKGRTVVAKTTSNAYGQYLFPVVPPNRYELTASRGGYISNSISVLAEGKSIIKCDIPLDKNGEAAFGTISGRVKHELGYCSDAVVGLYRIDNEDETLLKIGMTNDEGLYLFANVENGHYRVKAKMDNGEYCQEEFWL